MKLATGLGLAILALFAREATAQSAPHESFLEAPGPNGALKGTLLTPAAAPAAFVLIVPGSGPTDRDGNSPQGLKASTYRLLAEGLAGKGIATLRIDKRGQFASAAAIADPNAVTITAYADDVGAWIRVLQREAHAPCVWVLGHSEGGLVALVSAGKTPGECGFVLVATAGRPLGDVLREQLEASPAYAPLLGQALPAIDSLAHGHRVDVTGLNPALQSLFSPAVQGFLIDDFSYDPARLAAAVTQPVLVLQGARDIQVGVGDARLLAKADPRAHMVLLPDANHMLKSVASDDRRANIATYADPSLPLAPGVIDAIAGFVTRAPDAPAR